MLTARRVILAVGGRSYPGCGTAGDGYAMARRLAVPWSTRPALVPIRVVADWVTSSRGLSLPDVGVGQVGRRATSRSAGRRSCLPISA